MKTVLAINSSKRKKNTYGVLEEIAEALEPSGVNTDIVNLFEHDIRCCIGCEQCLAQGRCVVDDDMAALIDRMKQTDGIIVSSPVYAYQVSGKLKDFIDRTMLIIHRPVLTGKPALGVSTTMGAPFAPVRKYLDQIIMSWGMHPTGFIGKNRKTLKNPLSPADYERFKSHLFMDPSQYSPSLTQLVYYQVQKVLALKILPDDGVHWIEQGWNKQIYYFDCNIAWWKRLYAQVFYRWLYRKSREKDF